MSTQGPYGKPTPGSTRDLNQYLAKLSESAERYEDMVKYMNEVVKAAKEEGEFFVEERNLLSVAYKNTIGPKRTALRIMSGIAEKEKTKGGERVSQVHSYSEKIEEEIRAIAADVMDVTNELLKNTESAEGRIFFKKMQGDYYRYLAEFEKGEARTEAAANSKSCYEEAFTMAKSELNATHPIRLGLILNYSVYYYEIEGNSAAAVELGRDGFDVALAQLDEVPDENHKDSTLIMQLIRDNLTLWTPENEDEE